MSIRRMMLFTLGGFFKSIISLFKTRVLNDGGTFEAETNLENQLNTLGSDLFDSASLVITPNGVKTSKLYTIKPNDGTGDLDVVRATSATRVDEQGLIEIPRTNLLLQSDMFASPFWVKDFSSISPNDQISPDGTLTADTFTANGTTNIHQMYQNGNVTSGITYTNSIFAKKGTNDFIQLAGGNAAFGLNSFANFDLNNGTVGTVGSTTTASIQNIGNGWYRCIVTFTAISTTSIAPILLFIVNSSSAVKAQSNNLSTSVYLWGAQVEQGVTATEYIPTTSVIRTRFAGITQDGGSASNIPRIDYSTRQPAILVEPQSTNVHLNSSTMWNMLAFALSGGTVPTKSRELNITSPTGNNDAVVVVGGNGSTGTWGIYQMMTTVINSGQQVTVSVFAKAGSNNFIYLSHANISLTGTSGAFFNLSNGTTPTNGARIEDWGNGWYRCIMPTITLTANTSGSYNIGCYVAPSTSTNIWTTDYTGKSVYFFGIQVEAGSTATSYIPTTTSAVTRNADVISKSGIYTNGLITSAGGTMFIELKNNIPVIGSNFSEFNLGIGSTFNGYGGNGSLSLWNFSSLISRLQIIKNVGGTYSILYTSTTDNCKIVIKWNGTTVDVFENGVKVVNASSFNITNMNFLYGNGQRRSFLLNKMFLFNTPLTDAQAIQLTTL